MKKTAAFRNLSFFSALGVLFLSQRALADTSAPQLALALQELPDKGARFLQLTGPGADKKYRVIVGVKSEKNARDLGLTPVSTHYAVGTLPMTQWASFQGDPRVLSLRFSPPRHPLLDLASQTISTQQAHDEFARKGKGTLIGLVDTGIDLTHPSFLNDDGTTRVKWVLAFGQKARGIHPQLEEKYNCTGDDPCAIYSQSDINDLLKAGLPALLPQDEFGHGTHIASSAAGSDPLYPGVAPQAELIVTFAAETSGGVSDSRILVGSRFTFDRADDAQLPVVLNLSLGSSFGAHDGTSAVEKSLSEMAQGPGRAIVVAAGNSGELLYNLTDKYPEPLGIHTEVSVARQTTVQIPIIASLGGPPETTGAILAWITTDPGDELSIAFHNGRGKITPLVQPGDARGISSAALGDSDDYSIALINGVTPDLTDSGGAYDEIQPGNIVVAIAGTWQRGRVFEFVVEGHGNARIWLSATGTAGRGGGGTGPLVPQAQSRGTVAIPGTQPRLLTVGATVNRTQWTTYEGDLIGFPFEKSGRAKFSAAGPNLRGDLKPEMVAPGSGLIAAMSRDADPRNPNNISSIFSGAGTCPDNLQCYVIDDNHAITSGTSMSTPLVTGALALLFQGNPQLTMGQAKAYLMAGAAPLSGETLGSQVGAGELNILASLQAQKIDDSNESEPFDPQFSRVSWANRLAYPAPSPPLQGVLQIRDSKNQPSRAKHDDIEVRVKGPGRATWKIMGPGLAALTIEANQGSALQELDIEVFLGKTRVHQTTLPIALDPAQAQWGVQYLGGACATTPSSREFPPIAWWSLALLSTFLRLRRRRVY